MYPKTYLGPKTIEECEEQIALYRKRISRRPGSASRYESHIKEAEEALKCIRAGMDFDIETQWFK